jgi:hypothetical protein
VQDGIQRQLSAVREQCRDG